MSGTPAISVVMPVYNGEDHLSDALQSVLDQTWQDFEIVAVDDGSVDGSWSVLQRFAEADDRVRPVQMEENCGHHVASNRAMELARAPYLARLDQDDLALPTRLEESIRIFEKRPEVGLVQGPYIRWLPDGTRSPRCPPTRDTWLRLRSLFGNSVCHSALAIRRSALDQLDVWYQDLPGPQDYDLIVRLLGVAYADSVTHPAAVYRQSTMAMTEMFEDRMDDAVAAISARQLGQLLPSSAIPRVQRIYRLSGSDVDVPGVDELHSVFSRVREIDPRIDQHDVEVFRASWTAGAIRAALSGNTQLERSPRMVAAIVRSDKANATRGLSRAVVDRVKKVRVRRTSEGHDG